MIIERGNSVIRQAPERNWLILDTRLPKGAGEIAMLRALKMEVCAKHGVEEAAVLSRRRNDTLTAARAEFCQRAAALGIFTYAQIGSVINKDRTSVKHHVVKGQQ